MKDKIIRYSIILFSVVFALRVGTILMADRCYSLSNAAVAKKITPQKAISLINISIKLDSGNAAYHFKKYELLDLLLQGENKATEEAISKNAIRKQQLHLLQECIDLCPSWPAYHIYYALTLIGMAPSPNIITHERIISELKDAAELKPHSKLYQRIYQKYTDIYK